MIHAKILIIEDNEDLAFTLSNVLKKEGYQVVSVGDGESGLDRLQKELFDLVLLDLKLPKMNGLEVLSQIKKLDEDILVVMMTASTDAKPAIEALKKGAYDYMMKPFELDEMKKITRNALENYELKREVMRFRRQNQRIHPASNLLGESPLMEKVRELIQIIAETPRTSVLIQGDSGTGKELVANALHYASARKDSPFVKINCSAIPENLLESELFGHEKGAFTDARSQKKGLFELADGGTIFLDEIPSMKLTLQPKLLRAIETQTFRRVGGLSDIEINVRVIAATNSDLGELVKNKEFRNDLYYRLKVMEVSLPPLCHRGEDILLLAKVFLQEFNKEFNRNVTKLSQETETLILSYLWPGNVRELKNVIERGVILCKSDTLLPEHLPHELLNVDEAHPEKHAFLGRVTLQEMEKNHIQEVLRTMNGNKSQAAKILNISRSTLREKLKSYEIV
ncbi:sigma-54-dependent Fis family transcriptional regulator [candidate division KSB1 bacterium]|nr:sigma-54-dependent Fis family transcriptional regulator [candidate division KSB1 bacterium]